MTMSPHESSKQFPALAPGPPRMFAPQTSTAVSRPKKNSTACLACKAAKRKCSGPDAPCKACRSTNTECQFDPTRDLRRKVAVKRMILELTNHKDLLESLLSTLGSADQLQFDKVMDLIRNKASFQEIAHAVGSPATTFGDPQELSNACKLAILEYGENPVETSGNAARRPSDPNAIASSPGELPHLKASQWPAVSPYARVTLESLCDIPLFEVPAKPWTKVTDDDYLVSHLVSLYFTWDHPCSQFLDQRIFLEHMKRGHRKSDFCTPILVNSLLAMASAYSDSPDVLSIPENVFSRGQKFFNEAQRLWEVEDDDHDLPNIQALLLMCCVFKNQGRVRKSWMMLSQAVQLARDTGLFDSPAVPKNKVSPETERVRTITAWGVFNMSSQMSIEMQKISPLPYPTSDVKMCGSEDFDWTPYPRSNKITYDKKPARLPAVREGLAELTRILVDVQKLVSEKNHGTSIDELWRKAEEPFDRLNAWLQHWPSVAEIQQDPVPQMLLLRIKCLQAIIYLFEILNDPNQPQFVRQARYYQVKSAQETAQCLRVHRLSYGLKHIPSQIVDAVQLSIRILVHQLEESDESRKAFAELCQFGTALSHRFKQTSDVIHEIRKNAMHLRLRLPPEVNAIFDDPEQWKSLEP
ncbi:Transcription factor [Penicillium griseofulvum]|uniref:Transcription factor n=1 Tax=Penicillium patulum TaxID=5078 RepID=A0A135LYR5_PENPA|nr:Transcription factor [Penicillium griseofulvum]KXG54107.1 Transcription factor [Penicillium griseofulvum]